MIERLGFGFGLGFGFVFSFSPSVSDGWMDVRFGEIFVSLLEAALVDRISDLIMWAFCRGIVMMRRPEPFLSVL